MGKIKWKSSSLYELAYIYPSKLMQEIRSDERKCSTLYIHFQDTFFDSCKHLKLSKEHSCLQKFSLHKTSSKRKTIIWDENLYG